MRTIRRLIVIVLVAGLSGASAQQQSGSPEQQPAPEPSTDRPVPACTTDEAPYRDFDFWVGQWEVFDPESGRKLGDNRITLRERGCLLVERWESAGGGTGMSMNFYDPLESAWRQVWQSAAGFIDYTGGLDEQGRMVLEGTIHYNARNTSQPFRGRWTPREDGTVLQEFWQQNAETGEWDSWFVGEYRPR